MSVAAIAEFSSSSVEVMTSGDSGVTWTARGNPTDPSGGRCIAFNGSVLCALGFSSDGLSAVAMRSLDGGVSWTQTFVFPVPPLVSGSEFFDLIVVGTTFIAVVQGNNQAAWTSPDAVTWTEQGTIPLFQGPLQFNTANAIAYDGSSTYVAIGQLFDGSAATSPDLTTWTLQSTPLPVSGEQIWADVIWVASLGLFVAVGGKNGDGPQVMTSPDGDTWTGQTSPLSASGYAYTGIAFGAGILVAMSSDPDGFVITSTDAVNWTKVSVAGLANAGRSSNLVTFNRVRWISQESLFYACVALPANPFETILTSPDVLVWTTQTTAIADSLNDVAFATGVSAAFRNFWDNGMAPGVGNMFN